MPRRDRDEYQQHRQPLTGIPEVKPLVSNTRRAALPRWWKIFLVACAVYFGIALVGYMERQDQLMEMRQYCQMVHMWRQSGGEVGWPDYAEAYAQQCDGGTVRPEAMP